MLIVRCLAPRSPKNKGGKTRGISEHLRKRQYVLRTDSFVLILSKTWHTWKSDIFFITC